MDRSRDPEGSWRGSGNQYLNPDQHKRVQDVITAVRAAEKPLSEHMRQVERDNAYGSRLVGWERRLKGDDRLKEKVANELKITPALNPADALANLNDAIRYTFRTEAATYKDAYWGVKGQLEGYGYKMIYAKNHWRDDLEYKAVNTRWVTPEGQRFELQFHTQESFHAKQQLTHASYERIRNPLTRRDERRSLGEFQREVCSWINTPGDTAAIPDYEEIE